MLDYLIKNATVIDGTGAKPYAASVGVQGDTIACILRDGEEPEAKEVVDAHGSQLTPGFIDIHSHADISMLSQPEADSHILQGVTTHVSGNCGITLAPAYDKAFVKDYMNGHLMVKDEITWRTFAEWLDHVRKLRIGSNYVPLVGHNALRGSVMGTDTDRNATPEEEDKICALLEDALDAGAFGMSYSGDPGVAGHWANRHERIRLAKILEKRHSYLTAHTRHHQNQWPSDDGRNYYGVFSGERGDVLCGRFHGLAEFMDIAMEVPDLTCMYSHLTNAFPTPIPHSTKMEEAMIEETLAQLVDAPVAAGCKKLYFNVIPQAQSVGCIANVCKHMRASLVYDEELKPYADEAAFLRILPDPAFRAKLKTLMKSGRYKIYMLSPATDPYWAHCFAFFTAKDKSLIGKTLMEVTQERMPGNREELIYNNCMEVLFDLVQEDPELEWALIIDKREYQGTRRLLQHERCLPMSDNAAFRVDGVKVGKVFNNGKPPAAFDCFVRYLVNYCHEGGPLDMLEGIRRITSMPAEIMGLHDRGVIREGMRADLVLLDWNKLGFTNDFNHPEIPPTGIRSVWVNGVPALTEGKLTHALTGRVLTRPENERR
ncbi:MAG: amidohydrolase family protein [Oscillibacter sp.]|nr:amidohydrolase family protein [Oscillibacter sp.]